MTDRPILFSGSMVRAILAGTKTQTRRLVTPSRGEQSKWCSLSTITSSPRLMMSRIGPGNGKNTGRLGASMEHPLGGPLGWIECPYYQHDGDRLWVRETWRTEERPGDHVDGVRFRADDSFVPIDPTPAAAEAWVEAHDNGKRGAEWRPSIFCRRWMSRITLPILSVRVERLVDISEADAKAEGVGPLIGDGWRRPYAGAYSQLWDSINGKRAPWSTNPWVWVISWL